MYVCMYVRGTYRVVLEVEREREPCDVGREGKERGGKGCWIGEFI